MHAAFSLAAKSGAELPASASALAMVAVRRSAGRRAPPMNLRIVRREIM
jgi:hypothetical protein